MNWEAAPSKGGASAPPAPTVGDGVAVAIVGTDGARQWTLLELRDYYEKNGVIVAFVFAWACMRIPK